MLKADLIAIRSSTENDKSFIFATMLRGLYYGESWFSAIPKKIFMDNYHAFLERFYAQPKVSVVVACMKDDPEIILGYSIMHQNTPGEFILDYVFVKPAWRKIGIAKSLIPKNVVAFTHLTKVGRALKSKIEPAVFNPFVL